ncbi:MAG TPA: hypothetical protein ENN29_03340 [Candidatus Hydrogenedentes bacterium]|nr:hypothetical protein [Candidatus Hydrogenedentota bacterium]
MSMRCRIELLDAWRQRIAVFNEAHSLEATCGVADRADTLRCVLPHVDGFGPGCAVDLYINGSRLRRYEVARVGFGWDADFQPEYNTRAPVRDLMRVEADTPQLEGNTRVRRVYAGVTLEEAFLDIINRAPGPLHYLVDHEAYPDGAQREYTKLVGRISPENELETGGVSEGQWVGADRIDASGAYAKDGDTIAGLVVDGAAWPELRMMMIDADELALNNHAWKRHPETALWTAERYANSAYKIRADRAQAFLQQLLDTKGISHIELNPHRDSSGAFDDRVDAYGRYIGLVYGGGECFSAALVEQGLADVYLYADGQYHAPEHRLKEFFSYTDAHGQSYPEIGQEIHALDLDCGAMEGLTLLAYLAGGYVFSVSPELTVSLRDGAIFDYRYEYRADAMAVTSGFSSKGMTNWLALSGNRVIAPERLVAHRGESIGAYGLHGAGIDAAWLGDETDMQRLADGLLDDLAYPAPVITLTFFDGAPELSPGALVSVAGAPLSRRARSLAEEWGGLLDDALAGRVHEVRHFMQGKDAWTQATLSAPLRSVAAPLAMLRRIRSEGEKLFALRLDEPLAGLDQAIFYLGYRV